MDGRSLLKPSFWLGSTFVAGVGLRLGHLIFLSRMLPLEDFGKLQYVMTVTVFLILFSLPEMELNLARATAQGKLTLLRSAVGKKMRWSLIASLILCGYSGYFFYKGDLTLACCFVLTGCFYPLYYGLTLLPAYYYGQEDFKRGAFLRITVELLRSLPLLLMIFWTGSIIWAVMVMMGSVCFYQFVLYRRVLRTLPSLTDPEEIKQADYGRVLTLIALPKYLLPHLDKFLVAFFVDYASLALYACSAAPLAYFQDAAKRLVYLLLPKWSRSREGEEREWTGLFWWAVGGIALIITLLILLLPLLFSFLFPPNFAPALPLAQCQLLALFFLLPSFFLTSFFQMRKKTHTLTLYHYGTAGLFLCLTPLLLPRFGLLGAISAKVLAEFMGLLFLIFRIYRNTEGQRESAY